MATLTGSRLVGCDGRSKYSAESVRDGMASDCSSTVAGCEQVVIPSLQAAAKRCRGLARGWRMRRGSRLAGGQGSLFIGSHVFL
jgi:hypothetical protein